MLLHRLSRSLAGYAVAVAATSATTVLVVLLNHTVAIPNISLLYLPVILGTAVYYGTWPSLTAATVAVLQYDFFLLPPAFTFSIRQAQDVLAFAIFVIVAVLTSQLAAGARVRAEAAQRRAAESTTLYELGQALMSAYDVHQVLHAITERVVHVFGVDRCAVFVPGEDGELHLAAETLQGRRSADRASQAAATWVFRRGEQVGLPSSDGDAPRDRQRLYVPLRTSDRIVGVMEIGLKFSGRALESDEQRLVTSFAAQAALVIARAQGEEEQQRLRVLEETDRLKSALLSALSHDLRTPLASIKASTTSLLLAGSQWSAADGREFVEAIDHEADRLNRLVGNLLDLSRIEAGVLRPVLDWYDISEVVDGVFARLRPLLGEHPIRADVQSMPPVQLDLLRIEELLINLLENAARYTPPETPIELRAWHDERGLYLAVVDHGPGVPPEQRERIFDRFYRLRRHGDHDRGTGLGLAICQGIAQAHGGTIRVEDTPGGGATFLLTLPPQSVDSRVVV